MRLARMTTTNDARTTSSDQLNRPRLGAESSSPVGPARRGLGLRNRGAHRRRAGRPVAATLSLQCRRLPPAPEPQAGPMASGTASAATVRRSPQAEGLRPGGARSTPSPPVSGSGHRTPVPQRCSAAQQPTGP
jgi:hypothetical protein